jgi:peptidoglycan/LPS O-acetylase OafA/YrhL
MWHPVPPANRADDTPAIAAGLNPSKQLQYLPFVDGLRAISILAVVAYHVGVPGVPGGFVGVDIFFVISGFLIINQIKASLSSGRFSVFSFYAQRSLRILPLYLIVILLCSVAAPFFLATGAVYLDFVSSAALAPMMMTNIFFFLRQRYFDISAVEKPLLHTWTLSVEEQFYFVIPFLLWFLFAYGKRRFGTLAAVTGLVLAAASLVCAITETSMVGRNAAFYLPHCRAWEFAAGGFIGAYAVSAVRELPGWLADVIGWAGIACIAVAILTFGADTPYPSYNAALPVAGAALVILCGSARPEATFARVLSLRWFAAIGLVSYAWYLWHWPLLAFTRMARLEDTSLAYDVLSGGVVAFALACVSYRYIEQPIHRWRKSPSHVRNPLHIYFGALAACFAVAAVGGVVGLGGYWSIQSLTTARYGIEGQGVLDNGCEGEGTRPQSCFVGPLGVLVGDSHATVLFGTFAKRFDSMGLRLVSLARGACGPLMLTPSARRADRHDRCAQLIAPTERILALPEPARFAIITGIWGDRDPARLSELISSFDRRTRILLIGPVPVFDSPSLECVVLSDRYRANRDRCVAPRAKFETEEAPVNAVLKSMPGKFPNVRTINPIDVFCDRTTCRPFDGDKVLYLDVHHLSPAGADRLYDAFKGDFLWLAGKD